MDKNFQLKMIGIVRKNENGFIIELAKSYHSALAKLEGFSHLQIVMWGHLTDNPMSRANLITKQLFKKGPDEVGVFATRHPSRPNPILISTIYVERIDFEQGMIYTPFLDVVPETPVLDIKPYLPMERVKNCSVPSWLSHWPKWLEEASSFDWHNEINFIDI
jgi:tRNA (Thr-GGU) A37 N-methylase